MTGHTEYDRLDSDDNDWRLVAPAPITVSANLSSVKERQNGFCSVTDAVVTVVEPHNALCFTVG